MHTSILLVYLHHNKQQEIMTTQPIGQLKAKKTVYCTVCSSSLLRKVSVNIYHNTPEYIAAGKVEISNKLSLDYTCKICKSILKQVA